MFSGKFDRGFDVLKNPNPRFVEVNVNCEKLSLTPARTGSSSSRRGCRVTAVLHRGGNKLRNWAGGLQIFCFSATNFKIVIMSVWRLLSSARMTQIRKCHCLNLITVDRFIIFFQEQILNKDQQNDENKTASASVDTKFFLCITTLKYKDKLMQHLV